MQLKGKTVLITGGGSGIGRATAVALNAQGCRVVILGRTASKLATVPEATGLVCDITDRTQVETAIAAIHEQFGPVDILINNAGIQYNGEAPSTDQRIDTEIAVNLSAPVKLFSRLYNDLARRPGTAVVNVTSLLAYAPRRDAALYSATKAAMASWTRALRLQMRQRELLVCDAIPPLVDTALAAETPGSKVPPEDVADAIVRALIRNDTTVTVGISRWMVPLAKRWPSLATALVNKAT